MKFMDFIISFFKQLDDKEISFCVLRNFECFPEENSGRDIDLLVSEKDLRDILRILQTFNGVEVVGFLKRSYLIAIHLYGVEQTNGQNAIEIDLITALSWKGIHYFSETEVLEGSKGLSEAYPFIKVPDELHAAIILFLSNFLRYGFLKDKYWPYVQKQFNLNPERMILFLTNLGTEPTAKSIVYAVISQNKQAISRLLPVFKREILVKGFKKSFYKNCVSIISYYFQELSIVFQNSALTTVCFIGPDGAGKSTIINALLSKLENTSNKVQVLHLKPTFFMKKRIVDRGIVTDPYKFKPHPYWKSIIKVVIWVIELWLDYFLSTPRTLTLRLYDRCFFDIITDPRRYRYSGPDWFLKMMFRLIPSTDLLVVINSPAEVLQQRKQETKLEESAIQAKSYKDFRYSFIGLHYQENVNCIEDSISAIDAAIRKALGEKFDRKVAKFLR